MELRVWAERVLFGTTWAEKLSDPGHVTDREPGTPAGVVSTPGRPAVFTFRERGEGAPPSRLDDPQDRGRLLHAFANHELLATELMALGLLRFTDAPAAFRRGLATTLREEQTHLALYGDRMQSYGIELGDVPASGFFWTVMSSLTDPARFVAHMALTFEQANLDFALHYRSAFSDVGDLATADVLDRVLEDEIGHVGFGLRWFRRWTSTPDLLAAHEHALLWPVTPGRARGIGFEPQPRRQAGLPDSYIEAVRVYARPRGGSPDVHWYNPTVEEEIAGGTGYTPPRAVAEARDDLELTPLWVARPDDVVLVRRRPHPRFLERLADLVELPRFSVVDFERPPTLDQRPPGAMGLVPWGASPRSEAWSRHWRDGLDPSRDRARWSEARRAAHRKSTAASILSKLLERPEPSWMTSAEAPRIVEEMDGVRGAVEALVDAGYPQVAIKAELGTSGRGTMRIRGEMTVAQRGALERWIERDGAVVVEPWVDRVCDLSFRFTRTAQGDVRLDDIGRFFTDARGQYRGALLGRATQGLPADVLRLLHGEGRDPQRLLRTAHRVGDALASDPAYATIVGPIGVDAMVFRDPRSGLHLRPIVEVNPRLNMGHIAWRLSQHVAPGRAAVWMVLDKDRVAASVAPRYESRGPRCYLHTGLLPTTDPEHAHRHIAVLSAAATVDDALAQLDSGGGDRR